MESMDRRGPELLRVIYNDMDKEVGYSELRILQLYYMAANQE